ncbi:MAG: nicotinate-nucleotide adenylyltransferase [Eubacteriales bacterium]|nr:nicotinate-nucleotide adenylyltransferase [Eubacteriales bacterium]
MEKRKIGIMGGTFDPIHVGHLILGESAYQQFGLEKVLFMPSGNPPHKRNRSGRAALSERIEMVGLAIEDNPHFELSLAEAHEDGYTYTSKTLTRLTSECPDTEYYFIMGADSLFSFEQWKDPGRIAQLAILVVAGRDHADDEKLNQTAEHLKNLFHARIQRLSTPNIDISSKMLRGWIAQGCSTRYYIPDSVNRYISDLHLYNECE